jgi:hypothetical protein
VNFYAGVRFADALARGERDAVTRSLRSAGIAATSWSVAAERSHALLAAGETVDDARVRAIVGAADPEAVISRPPHAVLRVVPAERRRLPALLDAVAGRGRPAGVASAATEAGGIVLEIDVETTPLSTIVALVDAETHGARRIEPVLPLGDAVLAELAAAFLGDPALDASRLIETHLEPLLARSRP